VTRCAFHFVVKSRVETAETHVRRLHAYSCPDFHEHCVAAPGLTAVAILRDAPERSSASDRRAVRMRIE
jgi:hypothetical protein